MSAMLADIAPPPAAVIAEDAANDDEALGALWDKHERDNGAERDQGRFASPDPEKRAAAEAAKASPGGGAGEGQQGDGTPPLSTAVPLPANWQGIQGGVAQNIKDAWEKTPAELRSFVAQREQELQTRLSDHGRQVAAIKPLAEVISKHQDYFDGRYKMPDGSGLTPAAAVSFLFSAQRELDKDPVAGLLAIADRYGARDKLAAAFGKTVPEGELDLRREIAGLKQMLSGQMQNPASIGDIVSQKLQEEAEKHSAAEEVNRLSKDKPFYSEIPEADMVDFIHKSRRKLGETASKEAIFDLAYDMAVNADPDLRAKIAAAARPAAGHDPKKIADAKRAAGVNITSTSSGRGRELTEEEELGLVYDRNKKG